MEKLCLLAVTDVGEISVETLARKVVRREALLFILDSGSMILAMPVQIIQALGVPIRVLRPLVVRGAGGSRLNYFGQVRVQIWSQGWQLRLVFEVVDSRRPIISRGCLLGAGCEAVLTQDPHLTHPSGMDLALTWKEGLLALEAIVAGVETVVPRGQSSLTMEPCAMPLG